MEKVESVIDQALSILKEKHVDGYEVYLEESSHFEVESKDGKVDTFEASRSFGMAFRILNRQRIGFSYTTLSRPSIFGQRSFSTELEGIIEDAIASAEAISSDICFDFAPVLEEPLPTLPIFDEALEGVSEKEKIERARRLEATARSLDPDRIKKVRKASYQEVLSRKTLINSNGLQSNYSFTLTSVSVSAVAEAAGESEIDWDFDYSHFFSDLDVEKVGRSAGQKALERLGGRRIPSGNYPVLLDQRVASELLSLLAHSFLAEQIQKGKSHLKGKKGERFFSPLLSIVDDGRFPKGASTAPIDGEGMPTQQTCLVNRGEVSGYLYDRYWANRENLSSPQRPVTSTGNSRRGSIKSPPGIGISNLFIKPGELSFNALLKELRQGVLLKEVMGLHTVDPISGDFSLGCSGDWIERGEKAHPFKSVAIAGNLFELFKKLVGVGEDLRFFGGVGTPSLLIDGLEVSGN